MAIEYTTIYLEPFLKIDKRNMFNSFITNANIFPSSLMYQPNNPEFGVQTKIRMGLEYGIEKKNINDYATAMTENFYQKRLLFGNVKVAIGKDNNGTHLYDAVYVDMIDPIEGVNPRVEINNLPYFPASIQNMKTNFVTAGFLFNDDLVPKFMKTVQKGFTRPFEYVKSVVLCYTLPKQGSKILNRIRKSKFDFTQLDFDVDRIIVQDSIGSAAAKYVVFPNRTIMDSVQ
jgi:hypothetical protein